MAISKKIWAQFKMGELIVDASASFGEGQSTIFEVSLGNMSFGEIVSYLAGLVTGESRFSLPAPWNVLDAVPLKGLTLKIDATQSRIGVRYDLQKNFPFIKIQSFELWCNTQEKSLDLSILGEFFGTIYDQEPLTWDVINEEPPAVPGQGKELFELDYLGLGQHVALQDAGNFQSISEIIDLLMKQALPLDEKRKDPVAQLKDRGIVFRRDSHWLIGTKFKVMDTVALSAIFNDPEVYGLLVSLSGEKAGAFAGLSFEILYKKVTDDIGVYHFELKVPDVMRRLEFGAVSVTMAIIDIDIYTNGNFRLDFGFPRGLDFSRSFCVQAFPFIGSGGFYFALLTGATSERVPKISNGNFHPVIEFGMGLSIGVGKTIEKGVLRAGFYIVVTGILEGSIAWFNPDNKAVPSDRYYWLQGTIAIVGKLYGEVDFKVIKVNVSVVVYASATMVIEAYEPIPVILEVGVSVAATVRVLFIKIHFSFELHLRESFLIGSKGKPPWKVVSPRDSISQLRSQRSLYRSKPLEAVARQPEALPAEPWMPMAVPAIFNWSPVNVIPPEKKDLSLSLLPAFTVADADDGKPQVQAVMLLFAQNSIETRATAARDVLRVAGTEAPDAPFNLLVQGMLAWSIRARLGGLQADVTAADLEEIYHELSLYGASHPAFSYANLSEFFRMNFRFKIDQPDLDRKDHMSAAIVPMPPALSMKTSSGMVVDFASSNKVDETYEKNISDYFKLFAIDPEADTAKDPQQATDLPPPARKGFEAAGDETESMATVFFRDYFLMLTKASVQSAMDLLEAYPYKICGGDSLASIADTFNVKVDSLASANMSQALKADMELSVSGIRYQVKSGETFAGIAERFISDISGDRRPGAMEEGFSEGLADLNKNLNILRSEALMTVADLAYVVQEGDFLGLIAAWYLVRKAGQTATEASTGWFGRAIAEMNPEEDFDQPLEVGKKLKIPRVSGTAEGVARQTGTQVYQVKEGDVLDLIARYFLAVALRNQELRDLAEEIRKLNSREVNFEKPFLPGKKIKIPDLTYRVKDSDTLHKIAALFDTTSFALVTANAAAENLLAPLAVLAIPEIRHRTGEDQSLSDIAALYNLTVVELAEKIANTAGVFLVGEEITVSRVPQMDTERLMADLVAHGACNTIAAMVSRFMLHGLSLPDPRDEGFMKMTVDQLMGDPAYIAKLVPLYRLTGQQFAAPPVTAETFEIVFTNTGGVDWIEFFLFDQPADQLTLTLHEDFLRKNYPSVTFLPEIKTGPERLPLLQEMPARYTLTRTIPWQSADPPPFGGATEKPPGAGEPSIWLLPESLTQKSAAGGSTPYRLFTDVHENGSSMKIDPVVSYDWATALEIRVRQVPGEPPNEVMPNNYLMLGADETGRNLLRCLWSYLTGEGTADEAKLYLLYSPNPAGANPRGLVSDMMDRSRTCLLKTNLSTLTHSKPQPEFLRGLEAKAEVLSGNYFATIGAAGEFIRLLWECSVVGTGGFYLNYVNADGGAGIPRELFADESEATMWLVIVLSSQSRAQDPNRNLYAFNNAALVQDNIDAGRANVFAGAADQSDMTKAATVPPGHVGFQLTRPNPEYESESSEQKTRNLHSLLAYRVEENRFFTGSREGLPAGPTYHETGGNSGRNLPGWLNTDDTLWQYQHVVPVFKFAKVNLVPLCDALPPKDRNPYAGIVADPSGQELARVELGFAFHDIYGNRLTPKTEVPRLHVPVGYFDRLIGFSQWPGAAGAYAFSLADSTPQLQITIDLQIARYLPGYGSSYENAIYTASAHAEKYKQIYYQIEQEDVHFHLRTSLDQPLSENEPQAYAVQKTGLTHFVRASYMFLSTAQKLKPYRHLIQHNESLDNIANAYAVTVADLGKANETAEASTLFAVNLNIPKFHRVHHGQTLKDIIAGSSLDVAKLAENNRDVPLNPGITIQDYVIQPGDTFETLSEKPDFGSIAQLARANAALPNLFGPGTALYLKSELSALRGSLGDMTAFYGITLEQLCDANRQTPLSAGVSLRIPGLVFINDPGLNYASYVARGDETLSQIADKYLQALSDLVELNRDLKGLFTPAQEITIKSCTVITEVTDTFNSLLFKFKSQGVGLSLDGLAKATQDMPGLIRAGAFFACPLPKVGSGESLKELAEKFHGTVEGLAQANSTLHGFIRNGAEVRLEREIHGKTQVFNLLVGPHDTFNTLVARFRIQLLKIQDRSGNLQEPTIDEVARVNRDNTDLPASGQAFILPPNPAVISAGITPRYPDIIFPVTVELEMVRNPKLIDPEFKDVAEVQKNRTSITPMTSASENGGLSLRDFAAAFEETFPGLKAANGMKKALGEKDTAAGRMWAVNFSEGGISSFAIKGDRPRFFALKPLSTDLMARDVSIASYRSGRGLDEEPKMTNFQSVDLDNWAREFLAVFDRLLSPGYAVPAYRLDPDAYEGIVTAKAIIAEALKGQVGVILQTDGQEIPDDDLVDAREALYQRILIKLSNAYETDAVIQFPVAVTSNYRDKKTAPRFFGKPVSRNFAVTGPKPDCRLSAAKIPLAEGDQKVTFLLKVKSAEEQKSVSLNLSYQINELEYDIADITGIEDYQASSWLSFIIPFGPAGQSAHQAIGINTHIGHVEVPIPLRFYPTPPTLVSQKGGSVWYSFESSAPQPEIGQVKLWDYAITYEHRAAAQDTEYLQVVFNDAQDSGLWAKAGKKDLFDTLAQFTAVYPDLRRDLELLPKLQEGAGSDIRDTATIAIQSFANLATDVALAWQERAAGFLSRSLPQQRIYNYSLETKKTSETGSKIKILETLTIKADPDNPSVLWPRVFVLTRDQSEGEQALELPAIKQTEHEAVYNYPEGSAILAFRSLKQKFVFENCDVVFLQNARGGVRVARNKNLVSLADTHPDFIYQTPLVRFNDRMTPLLEYDETLSINFHPGLKESLSELFKSLFTVADRTWEKGSDRCISVACRYGYELVASVSGEEPIMAQVPVLFQPRYAFKLDPENPDWSTREGSFVDRLCRAIETWERNYPTCRKGGFYIFELQLYSSLDETLMQPLLQLKSLRYDIASDS